MEDKIYTEAFCPMGGKLWYSAMIGNKLYCLDLATGRNVFVDVFPEKELSAWRNHVIALSVGEKIYFLPDFGGFVHIFEPTTGSIEAVALAGITSDFRFFSAVASKRTIYLFSRNQGITVLAYETDTKRCRILPVHLNRYDDIIMRYPARLGEKFYFPCANRPCVYVFDSDAEILSCREIHGEIGGCGTIVYDGECFWLSQKTGFLRWNEESGIIDAIPCFPKGFSLWRKNEVGEIVLEEGFSDHGKAMEFPFWCSAALDGKIYFFSRCVNMNVVIDGTTRVVERYDLPGEEETAITLAVNRPTWNHYFGGNIGDRIFISSSRSGKFYVITSDGRKEYPLTASPKERSAWLRQKITGVANVRPEGEGDLAGLIKGIREFSPREAESFEGENYGKKIYECVKGTME